MSRIPVGTVLLLLSIVVTAPAAAQVAYFQAYTDPALQENVYHCGTSGTTAQVFIVLGNADVRVSAVDFHVDYPPGMVWITDLPPDDNYTGTEWATIGQSPTGIAIAWANCCMTDGSERPFVVMRALVYWPGSQCPCSGFTVGGYAALGKTQPSYVRDGDFAEFSAVGRTSYRSNCETAVEPSTWGRVKSLYR